MSAEMFSGWGIRTLSAANPAYDPYSYHRGSVWPVENAEIAFRLAKSGFQKESSKIIEAQLELATLFPKFRLPEVVTGHARDEDVSIPGLYPHANLLQAWSVSAVLQMVQAMAGVFPDSNSDKLSAKTVLPPFLDEFKIENFLYKGVRVNRSTTHCF